MQNPTLSSQEFLVLLDMADWFRDALLRRGYPKDFADLADEHYKHESVVSRIFPKSCARTLPILIFTHTKPPAGRSRKAAASSEDDSEIHYCQLFHRRWTRDCAGVPGQGNSGSAFPGLQGQGDASFCGLWRWEDRYCHSIPS